MRGVVAFALAAAVTVGALGWLAWQYVAAAGRLQRAFEYAAETY